MLEDREFDTDQGSLPSPIIGNWLEARQEIQAGLHGGPAAAEEARTETASFVHWPEGEVRWFLLWGEVRGVSRGVAGGVP